MTAATILKLRPGKTADHADPKPPRISSNRIAPDLEAKARELLRDGVAGKAVAKRLGISQSAAYRVLSEVRPVARVSSKPDYRKIYEAAEKEREARLALVRAGVQQANGVTR